MFALLYLVICFALGYVICSYAFPGLKTVGMYSYGRKQMMLNPNFIVLPAYFLVGTIAQTWCVYLLGYLFKTKENPLVLANVIGMSFFAVVSLVLMSRLKRKSEQTEKMIYARITTFDKIVILGVCILTYTLMWKTFFVKAETLNVGYTVYSDFSPHL